MAVFIHTALVLCGFFGLLVSINSWIVFQVLVPKPNSSLSHPIWNCSAIAIFTNCSNSPCTSCRPSITLSLKGIPRRGCNCVRQTCSITVAVRFLCNCFHTSIQSFLRCFTASAWGQHKICALVSGHCKHRGHRELIVTLPCLNSLSWVGRWRCMAFTAVALLCGLYLDSPYRIACQYTNGRRSALMWCRCSRYDLASASCHRSHKFECKLYVTLRSPM